jgi:hypothetical protein
VRISVGVPAYNQGQYLAATLESLLTQTVPPDEIVVSDNHSTDETPDVLRRYEGRVRVIRPPVHLSMPDHWSFVGQNLSCDWFSILSSDDVADARFVEHLSKAATRERDAVLVRGGWELISPSGESLGHHRLLSTAVVTRPPVTFLEQLRHLKTSIAAFLCRHSAFSDIGGFSSSMRLAFDRDFFLRLSPTGSFITTHRIIGRYRTGYPAGRRIGRLVDGAHDECVMALDVYPKVARALGLPLEPMLRDAAAYRLTEFLALARETTDPDIRTRVAAELRPMAQTVALGGLLDDFVSGHRARNPTRVHGVAHAGAVLKAQLETLAYSVGHFVRHR